MKPKPTHTTLLTLLGILLLAALLRFGWVGTSSFSFDEARVSDLALRMAQNGEFALLGMQTSTGVPNFPGAVWLFALPYRFSSNPQIATHFAALLNLLGVLGIWWLGKTAWGDKAGLIAALFMAVAPFMVFYSRSIWSQNLLAPLGILWATTAVLALRDISFPPHWRLRPRWHGWLPEIALLLHTFLAGFIFQVHPAGIGLTLGSLWLGVRFRLWHRWLPIVGGILLGTLAALPGLWAISQAGGAGLGDLLGGEVVYTAVGFTQLLQLATAHGWEAFWLTQNWVWASPLNQLLSFSTLGLGILALGGMALLLYRMGQDMRHRAPPTAAVVLTALVPAWAIASPLFFVRSSTPVYHQYQLASVPAIFLGMAACLVWLERRHHAAGWVVGLFVLLTAVGHTSAITHTLNNISHTLIEGGMGTPLSYTQRLTDTLRATGQPVVVHAVGDVVEFDGDAAVFRVLFWDYPHQLVDGRHLLLFPAEGGTLLFPAENVPSWGVLQGVDLGGDTAVVPRRTNDLPFLTYTISPLTTTDWQNAAFTLLPDPISLANGAALYGWRSSPTAQGQLRLLTLWRITQPPPAGQFQQFNHLYHTPSSPTPDQGRDATTSSAAWQQGDWLLTWADFDPPPNQPDRFEVGMYLWPELSRSPLTTGTGDVIQLYIPTGE